MNTASIRTALILLTAIFAVGCGQKSEEPKAISQPPDATAVPVAPAPSVTPSGEPAVPATPGALAPSGIPAAPAAGTPAPQAPAGK